jgi:hypothetical protein
MTHERPTSSDHRPSSHGDPIHHSNPAERVDIPAEWLAEFDAAARRPLKTRFRYVFIKTYKPVLDDEPFRAFDTTADYRRWCEKNLPDWPGYGRE